MPMQLTPLLQAKVEAILSTGHFVDADDVLDEALRLLAEHERDQRLRATLVEAEAQTARGDVFEWTSEMRAAIWRDAEQMVQRGTTPDPDVCP